MVVSPDVSARVPVEDRTSVDVASRLVEITPLAVVGAAEENVSVGRSEAVAVVGVVADVRLVAAGVCCVFVVLAVEALDDTTVDVDGEEVTGAVVSSVVFAAVLVEDGASVDVATELVEITPLDVVGAVDENVVAGRLVVVDVVGVVVVVWAVIEVVGCVAVVCSVGALDDTPVGMMYGVEVTGVVVSVGVFEA